MERDRGFNFKLLVPRRVNAGEISAVRPQGRVGDFINTMEESHNKCHDKEPTMPFPNTSLTAPTKPTRQGIFYSQHWLQNFKTGIGTYLLYSKLFDEVEKIKCWKVKVDSDSVQNERRLQDNKRTMETQRKAIQELQFGNESLSVKLEEQISENEDLRNKNNATRNLCNILKDTFQWSAEKMHLFESEREETHHLFVQASDNVKKLTEGFESLRIQVEADQQEMLKGVVMLKAKLHETQKQLMQLQEAASEMMIRFCSVLFMLGSATFVHFGILRIPNYCMFTTFKDQQLELLRSSKSEQNSLLQKLHTAEQRCKETEVSVVRFLSFQVKLSSSVVKQIGKEVAKSSQFETGDNKRLQEESQNFKKLKEEDHQKLLKELESKSNLTAELENEVCFMMKCCQIFLAPQNFKKLSSTAAEAIKNKEDTELKCQHKIADMVALMEKHKSQYDRMVDKKDAELEEVKKKEMDAVTQVKSLVLDLSKHKTESDELKKLLKTETTEKENLQKKLIDLNKEKSSVKASQTPQTKNKQSIASDYKQVRCFETPIKSSSKTHIFDFSMTRKTPSYRNDDEGTSVIKKTHIFTEDLKTPGRVTNRVGGTSKMKLYRIRTPPSAEKAAQWGKSTIELDPRSDSSDQNDLLLNISAPRCKLNIFKKLQSPATHKSPGNSLKLAAMKRMRDAGWTAVTGCDRKKKKTTEKIFA
uniref:Synaptonemal complex protein 1 n=1 Tax=Acanthochromis polyacanthus TaxID=80966 RepID=A0A3Q1F791_9TELE